MGPLLVGITRSGWRPLRPRGFRGQSHVRHRAPFAGIPDESRRCGHGRPPRGIMVGTHPAATGWVPDAAVLEEPTAEGIHKDGDGPDQASDSVDDLAHLPGRSPVLADLGATALGLGHGPHLLPGSSPPRQGQRVIRGEVPEKARQAYGMGCGGVDTIPTQRRGSSAWARMMSGGRPRRWATSATERQWTVTSGGGGRDGPS